MNRFQVRRREQGAAVHSLIENAPRSTKAALGREMRAMSAEGAPVARTLAQSYPQADIRIVQELPLLNIVAAELTDAQAAKLRDDGFEVVVDPIVEISPPRVDDRDFPTRVASAFASSAVVQKQVSRVRADEAWKHGYRGNGITVAVVDSGVRGNHESFLSNGGRILRGKDFLVGVDGGGDGWNDDVGHGTHVAGIVVGADGIGVAPDAKVLPLKVFRINPQSGRGEGRESDILAAFFEAIKQEVDVINFSGGQSVTTSNQFDWDTTLRLAKEGGVVVVAAAGNLDPNDPSDTLITSPGAAPGALTVGALTDDDRLASFTLRGGAFWSRVPQRKPDLAAPGVDVLSAYPFERNLSPSLTRKLPMPGTSMATPIVAGLSALVVEALKQKGTPVTVDAVRNALTTSATRRNPTTAGALSGAGVPDAFEALRVLDFVPKGEGTTGPVVNESDDLKRLKERIEYWRSQGFPPVIQ